MIQHTARAFDADLKELRGKIAAMGGLVQQQGRKAIEALSKRDAALASRIVATDDQIDAMQRDIEEKAIVTIARRQPMAVDLREIVGALRISNDLERVGDLAESMAKHVMVLTDESPVNEVMLQLQSMARRVLDQLAKVLQSYQDRDVVAALDVWRRDQEIDAFNNSLFRELLAYMMESPRDITFCTLLLFCAKNIERMGDHATNIAETVYYIVEGQALSQERPKADVIGKAAMPEQA